jgi:uncharacterized protein (TIGR02996 family)
VSEFNEQLGKAIRYNADEATVSNLLGQLATPEHRQTRLGKGDHTLRLVAADALQDRDREEEANLLRQEDQHVVIDNGTVKKGRLTHKGVPDLHTYYPDRDGDGFTIAHHTLSDEYMIGSHWGGPVNWLWYDVSHAPTEEAVKEEYPNAVPHHVAFPEPDSLYNEVQREPHEHELNEEVDTGEDDE